MKPIKLILSLVMGVMLFAVTSSAQNGYVYAIAGNQVGLGYSGDGGPAIDAELNFNPDIEIDGAGNIYITDPMNNRIRKIDANTGTINTIAGNGTSGFSGDGGPAVNAQFHSANFIALDTAGNIYICDELNWRIRKVDVNGTITTIAGVNNLGFSGDGGPAISSNFQNPRDVAVDKAGNIYIADESRLRKIDIQTGIINTICGNGNSGFTGDGGLAVNAEIQIPYSITFDSQGNIFFISDARVRRIDAITGIITTVCGSANMGTSGDGGLATNALLEYPVGLMIDESDNIYIAEQQRIRKISVLTGLISTIAGGLGNGYNINGASALQAGIQPFRIVKNIYGTIFCANAPQGEVIKITGDAPVVNISSALFSVQTFAQCNGPQFSIATGQYNANYTVRTFYGDGTNDLDVISPSNGGGGYVVFTHSYSCSGTYTIKHVLLENNIPVDSIQYSYQYTMCRNINVGLYIEDNNNCIYEPNIDFLTNQVCAIAVDSNGITIDTLYTNSTFTYNMQGAVGDNYTFTVTDHPYGLVYSCPLNGTITETLQSAVYTGVEYIGFECSNTTDFDLGVALAFVRSAANRADFDMVITNASCYPKNATLTLTFSPKYEIWANRTHPEPTSQTANTLTWNISDLSAVIDEPKYVHAMLQAHNNVLLTVGDTIQTSISLSPTTGDLNLNNNTIVRHDTVTGPYDPNAVYVNPTGCVTPGTNLEYTITFENLGNDTAHNVYIMDTLNSGVDMQSMKLITASHTMNVTKVTNGGYNILKFDFPNIDLADSPSPARHGFVMYTIDSKDNYPIGSAVTNKAGIFFDYMPAVLTNVAETYMCWPASVNTVTKPDNIRIYPNPVTGDELTILTEQAYASYIITNSIGQELMNNSLHGKDTKVNIKPLATGIYYITLKGDNGTAVKKFVKL